MKQASFNFMTAVTVCSDFGAQENKVCHCFHCFPIYFHEMMGPGAMVLVFWMLRFKWAFSLSFFTLIRKLFSSPWEWEPRYSAPHLQSLTLCVAGTNNCRHIQIIAASSIHYIHSVLRGWLKLKSKLWGKARVGCFERTASKHVDYLGWNRSPAQVGFMRQVLGPGAPGRPRGIGWRGRWEGGSGWGIHVNPWLIHVNIWQKPVQYCKVITFQLIKIKGKKKAKPLSHVRFFATSWAVAYQAPPSMGFSRQEYWSGLPFPSSSNLCSYGFFPLKSLFLQLLAYLIPLPARLSSDSTMSSLLELTKLLYSLDDLLSIITHLALLFSLKGYLFIV